MQGFSDVGTGHPGTESAAFASSVFVGWSQSFYDRMRRHVALASSAIGARAPTARCACFGAAPCLACRAACPGGVARVQREGTAARAWRVRCDAKGARAARAARRRSSPSPASGSSSSCSTLTSEREPGGRALHDWGQRMLCLLPRSFTRARRDQHTFLIACVGRRKGSAKVKGVEVGLQVSGVACLCVSHRRDGQPPPPSRNGQQRGRFGAALSSGQSVHSTGARLPRCDCLTTPLVHQHMWWRSLLLQFASPEGGRAEEQRTPAALPAAQDPVLIPDGWPFNPQHTEVRLACARGTCMTGRFTAAARQQGSAARKIRHQPRPGHAAPAARTRTAARTVRVCVLVC